MNAKAKEAKRHLEKLRKLVANTPSPFQGMTLEEAIVKMRKTRERLWEEKLALRS